MSDLKLEVEARLVCPGCGSCPYRLYRVQNSQRDGEPLQTFRHVLWPTNAAILPPVRIDQLNCPDCGRALQRQAP